MKQKLTSDFLKTAEALASPVRIDILNFLSKEKMNIGQLSEVIERSASVTSKHIRILEETGLVRSVFLPGKSGLQKRVMVAVDRLDILFPERSPEVKHIEEIRIPIGSYLTCQAGVPCGLNRHGQIIGEENHPEAFYGVARTNAESLWFNQGNLMYKIPNPIKRNQEITSLEIEINLAAFHSQILGESLTFKLNDCDFVKIFRNCTIPNLAAPLEIADSEVKESSRICLLIDQYGSWIAKEKVSTVTLAQINLMEEIWALSFAVDNMTAESGIVLFEKHQNEGIVIKVSGFI